MRGPIDLVKYPEYAKAYAKRHRIAVKLVVDTPLLNACAMLENKVRWLRMDITQARYRLLKQFPTLKVKGKKYSLNCIPSSGVVVSLHGYSFRASVIDLVRPLQGCMWGVPKPYRGDYEKPIH
jgi:hypothetical protein